jgi:hypothetical protein
MTFSQTQSYQRMTPHASDYIYIIQDHDLNDFNSTEKLHSWKREMDVRIHHKLDGQSRSAVCGQFNKHECTR